MDARGGPRGNDGIISTASLIVGVSAGATTQHEVLIAGVAELVGGAMSMATGECVSVSSQSDTEGADLARERREMSDNPAFELDELAEIYVKRGVDQPLARQVAQQLMAMDALTVHARDEQGTSEITAARPVQAASDVDPARPRGDLKICRRSPIFQASGSTMFNVVAHHVNAFAVAIAVASLI